MKIGIFGGSFNPVHLMHKNIALELIRMNYIDKVIYVPTGGLYEKKGLVSEFHRYKMLELTVEGNNNLEVDDYEFGRLTYTYETLDYFREKYKGNDIYFICGTDNLKEIDSWKKANYILDNYGLIVIKRNDDDIIELLAKYKDKSILVVDNICNKISSTEIRSLLKGNRDSFELSNKLDGKVLKYIKDNDLYC